ncbi:sensor histidine kinase [Tenggerimyces flavus]|uniref:histidine kinase n=1 Tax=Tenggerimyces flavus TaxID=1708749 RepID=A0ABV7YAZ8_9ACTN|nr:histidine kinase [Tenggerimyces flavus]MBM7785675.1 signal transduction histidine kinase [Tenggerimyces flavus]
MGQQTRTWIGVAAGAVVVLAGVWMAFAVGSPFPVATAAASGGWLALAISWPYTRSRVPIVTATAATMSFAATVFTAVERRAAIENTETFLGFLMLVETAALLALIAWCARSATIPVAVMAGGAAALAQAAILLRSVIPASPLEFVGLIGFWGLGSLGAAGIGIYIRWLDEKRERAVDTARRAQRMDLARDLHDFVAHDVSGIVVQAQAAQVILPSNPAEALAALKRIEDAGLQALDAMDRTVHMLHDATDLSTRSPAQGLAELPEVVSRFGASGSAAVSLSLPAGLADTVPREVNTTAYRVVVEALTNVRRHAPSARSVKVAVTADKAALTVTVTNDESAGHAPALGGTERPRSGLGLLGLTERVEAVGGTLTAGPLDADGWRTEAVLPLPEMDSE